MNYAQPAPRGAASLIVNADDFGLTEGVCAGITRAIRIGSVTTTSAMVCTPDAATLLARWAPFIPGRIGAHLQLTTGRPVLGPARVPTLTTPSGSFAPHRRQIPTVDPDQLFDEWRAQVEVLLALGIRPTHVDTHHHVHGRADIFEVFCRIASQYGLPARPVTAAMVHHLRARGIPCVDCSILDYFDGDLSIESLLRILASARAAHPDASTFELMCHPGINDAPLASLSRYLAGRDAELHSLTSPDLPPLLAHLGFELISYHTLAPLAA